MHPSDELIQLLTDTRRWASGPANVDTSSIYSDWESYEVLLSDLDQHLADARSGQADFSKLRILYAPTAGLGEIVASDGSRRTYLSLASRFDAWYGSARAKD